MAYKKHRYYRENDYKPLYRRLDYDFKGRDIKSKEQLKLLMNQFGYRYSKKEHRNLETTDKQLNTAWEYLYKQKTITDYQEDKKDFYYQYEGKRRRARKTMFINGKRYKPGWFIPYRESY